MKDWTGNKKSVAVMLGASNLSEKERQADDFYATPPRAIDALFEVEDFAENIWEPACGQGHLSKRMEELGKKVLSTDLVDRGYGRTGIDFLGHYSIGDGDVWNGDIITNPPYKYALKFLKQALDKIEEGSKVAFFLKIQFLEGQARAKFFEENPPRKVYVFSKRISCAMNGEFEKYNVSAMCHCWFVWHKGYKGSPEVEWI